LEPARLDDILRRARLADPSAYGELLSAYAPRVFGLLYRITGTREAAEDLVQETFLRVVRNLSAYDDQGKFESWLFRIAANLARDEVRRSRRRGRMMSLGQADEDEGQPRAVCEGQERPEDRLERSETGQRLEACLARLSAPEREVLMLRHYSELSFREIAALLGVPLGTALARAHRALARLKREFEGQEGGGEAQERDVQS